MNLLDESILIGDGFLLLVKLTLVLLLHPFTLSFLGSQELGLFLELLLKGVGTFPILSGCHGHSTGFLFRFGFARPQQPHLFFQLLTC